MNYVKEIREKIGTRPFILVGAAIIVKDTAGRILLQLRSDTNEWGLPGGAMEPGESLQETAARELFEETGLEAHSLEHVDTYSGKHLYFQYPNGDEVYNVIAVFVAEKVSGPLRMRDGESLDLQYFNFSDPPQRLDGRAEWILQERGGE